MELENLNQSMCGALRYIPEDLNESMEGKKLDNGMLILASLKGPIFICNMSDEGEPLSEVNGNSRWYKKKLGKAICDSEYLKEMLERNALLMEGDHPEDRMDVAHDLVVARVREVRWVDSGKGGYIEGIVDILDTTKGKDLAVLVKSGYVPGVSIRATGVTMKSPVGGKEVQLQEYRFYTWDFVWRPGFKGALLETVNEANGEQTPILPEDLEIQAKLNESILEKEELITKSKSLESLVEDLRSSLNESKEYIELVDKSSLDLYNKLEERDKEYSIKEELLENCKEELKGLNETISSLNEKVNILTTEGISKDLSITELTSTVGSLLEKLKVANDQLVNKHLELNKLVFDNEALNESIKSLSKKEVLNEKIMLDIIQSNRVNKQKSIETPIRVKINKEVLNEKENKENTGLTNLFKSLM